MLGQHWPNGKVPSEAELIESLRRQGRNFHRATVIGTLLVATAFMGFLVVKLIQHTSA